MNFMRTGYAPKQRQHNKKTTENTKSTEKNTGANRLSFSVSSVLSVLKKRGGLFPLNLIRQCAGVVDVAEGFDD